MIRDVKTTMKNFQESNGANWGIFLGLNRSWFDARNPSLTPRKGSQLKRGSLNDFALRRAGCFGGEFGLDQ